MWSTERVPAQPRPDPEVNFGIFLLSMSSHRPPQRKFRKRSEEKYNKQYIFYIKLVTPASAREQANVAANRELRQFSCLIVRYSGRRARPERRAKKCELRFAPRQQRRPLTHSLRKRARELVVQKADNGEQNDATDDVHAEAVALSDVAQRLL